MIFLFRETNTIISDFRKKIPVLLLILLWAGQSLADASKPACRVQKVTRQPVVIKGSGAIGFSVAAYEAWALAANGKWQNIVMQIDEVNPKGEFVMKEGQPYTAYSDDGILDGNDEMVFWGSQLGREFAFNEVPPDILKGAKGAWRLNLCDGDFRLGSVLLVAGRKQQNASFTAAARFNPVAQTVESSHYRYWFNQKHPILLGKLVFQRNKEELPLLAESWFQMAMRTPWWVPDIHLTEESFTSSIECWQQGPIRTLVAVGVKFKKLLSLLNVHMFSELVFYEQRFQIPTVLEFPIGAGGLLKFGSGVVYMLRVASPQWTLDSNLPVLDPRKSQPEGPANPSDSRYRTSVDGPWGRLKVLVELAPQDSGQSKPLPFRIDPKILQPPSAFHWDWMREIKGDVGVFVDISKVKKGVYHFNLDLSLEPEADLNLHDVLTSPSAEWVKIPLF